MPAQIDKYMWNNYPVKSIRRILLWALIEGRPVTTKGRWINSVVFSIFRLSTIFKLKMKTENPIFIVGTGRSGTTVLGKIFAIRRDCAFLNEPKAMWHYAHGQEDVIGSYSKVPGSFRLPIDIDMIEIKRKLSAVYSLSLFISNADRVIDKYPELIFRSNLVKKLFPESKLVAIIRNGVDTCSSVVNWSQKKGSVTKAEKHDWWGVNDMKWKVMVNELIEEHPDLNCHKETIIEFDDHRDRAAFEWIVSMREVKNCNDLIVIKYEDLCNSSASVLKKIETECNLVSNEEWIEYSKEILQETPPYSKLAIKSQLLKPFQDTLLELGYKDSMNRVIARD